MKNKNKKNYLLGILLSTLMIVGIINITNGQTTIDTNPDSSKLHTPSLFSLFLGDNSDYTNIKIKTGEVYLDILNGLVVGKLEGKGNMISGATLSVIGGGSGNMINSNNAGIGGGLKNKINNGENGAIGGGYQNEIGPQNNSKNGVIIGGLYNTDDGGGTILGGQNNKIASKNNGGIILGGQNNVAGTQSLVLGSYTKLGNAPSSKFSFIWNQDKNTTNYSARINTTGGMLINTLSPVKGVSLIVSGAINYGNKFKYNNTGGIYFNPKGCMKFFDGNVHKTLGKASIYTDCSNDESGCQFGAITLNNGDIMTAYSVSYTGNCQNASGQVTCINGEMVDNNNKSDVYVYPYCYNLSDDPIIQVEKGYQNCTKKPNHSHWTNPHFIQTLNTSTNKYEPENRNAVYDPTGSNDCSFDCDTNYTYSGNKCEGDTKRIDCDIPNELNINNIDWYFSPQYPATRGGIARASLNHETKKYSPGDTVYCKYVCKSGYTGEYCNETINYTCENKPSGSGYIFGSGTYTYGHTPTLWTYTENNNPGACQFTCNEGYKRNSQTNKCEQTIPSPVCGKEVYTCSKGNPVSLSNNIVNISGTSYYLDNNFYIMIDEDSVGAAWICKNGDKVVNCGCENKNRTCPYAYIRDPEKKMCKYSPRFCIGVLPPNAHNNQKYIEGEIINNSNSRDKYKLNCFDKTFSGGEYGEIWTDGTDNHSKYGIDLNNYRLENVKYPYFTVNSPNGINGKYFYTYSGLDSPIYNSTKIEYNNKYVKNFMNYIIENQYCKLEKGKGIYSTYPSQEHIDYDIGYYLDCDIPDDVFESGRNPDYYYDNINAQNRYHDRFYINTKQTDLPYCQ